MGDSSAKYGFPFVNGPSGTGKTEALRAVAETTPETSLLDTTGLSTEHVMDSVMRVLGVSYGDSGDVGLLVDDIRDQRLSRVLLVANAQWAGRTRSTTEPQRVAGLLAQALGSPYEKSGVKVVIEVDSSIHARSDWIRSPLTLSTRPDVIRLDIHSLPSRHRTAVQALALAELRSVRFEEWRVLCSVLGVELGDSELRDIAAELGLVSVGDNCDPAVSLPYESDAHALRAQVPAEQLHAFYRAVVDQLFSCGDDDPLSDYLARALPAHAAVAGRFEELLSRPPVLAKCDHTALIEALPVAFPQGVPAGTHAADLHYFDALGVAPSSHAEWLSLLHLLALSQGDPERAHALTASAGPLPWRTVWTNWRAPGRLRASGPRTDAIDVLRSDTANSTVTSISGNGTEQTWDAITGRLTQPGGPGSAPHSDEPRGLWRAEASWNVVRLQPETAPAESRFVQAPTLRDAACVGELVVLGGNRGLYAIKPDLDYTDTAPLHALPAVGPRGRITPRPYDEAACRPTRQRVLDIWPAKHIPTLPADQLPSGLTHEPTRRFLTEVGFPAVSDFYGLDTHNLVGTGLAEHGWEGTKSFNKPVGDGPFYALGTWIGGVLLLDGPTGRVLRQTQPSAVDGNDPGEPLTGSSLAQFVAMVCLQWEYMLAYTTSGGLDGTDLLAELTTWLTAVDPAAAATQNWGHVLDQDNFPYL
ncbi:SUKH-4 family immunity protein [Streptomyces sp. NPDC004129]